MVSSSWYCILSFGFKSTFVYYFFLPWFFQATWKGHAILCCWNLWVNQKAIKWCWELFISSLQSHQSLKYTIVVVMLLKVIMWHYTVTQLVILHLKWPGSGLEKFWWNTVLILYQLSTEISQECTSVWHGMELATFILLIVQFMLNVSKSYIIIHFQFTINEGALFLYKNQHVFHKSKQ